MNRPAAQDFACLYHTFRSPITALDCGNRCAPYNQGRAPFCCDTRHAVPTAYRAEWDYLQASTNLWHTWQADKDETRRLKKQTPSGQVLVECLGHTLCQREFRTLTCRAFPFFPYFTRGGDFIGMSYYWDYEQRCWVISNLQAVTAGYRAEFFAAYNGLFERMPQERDNFRHHSMMMRRIFGQRGRAIPLLHRDGHTYKVSPRNGRMRRVPATSLPKFGPFKVAARLRFPDESL
jgi:hypothetical protein